MVTTKVLHFPGNYSSYFARSTTINYLHLSIQPLKSNHLLSTLPQAKQSYIHPMHQLVARGSITIIVLFLICKHFQ